MKKQIDINYSIHNRFDIKVFDAKTNELKQEAKAYNIIVNKLWERMLSNNNYQGDWFRHICVGSGTGTPSVSDTDLFHREYTSSTWDFNDGLSNSKRYAYSNGVFSSKASIIIPALSLVGVNITEVGIGWTSGITNILSTHAMIKDLSGNQISILKTDTDIIQIIATVYVHALNNQEEIFLPLVDSSGYVSGVIQKLLGDNDGRRTIRIDSLYTDPYKRFPRRKDKLLQDWSNIPPVNNDQRALAYEIGIIMEPVSGDAITEKSFTTSVEGKWIKSSYRINAQYWNTPYLRDGYKPEYYTYGIRLLQIQQFNYLTRDLQLNYKVFFTPQPIIKEAIGTGDGTTQVFATKFPCVNLSGQVYINNNLSSGYFVDYEPYACSLRGNGYFHKLEDSNSNIIYNGRFQYQTFNQDHPYWYGFDNSTNMQTYNYTKDTYVLDNNLDATLQLTIPQGNFPYYTDALSGDENGNIKLSGILFTTNGHFICRLVIEGSNDLINWTTISNEIALNSVNRIQFQPYSYIRFKILEISQNNLLIIIGGLDKEHGQIRNIFFPTPPAPGDIITATYTPDCIPKDDQHVFDIDITYNFDEYQGNQ